MFKTGDFTRALSHYLLAIKLLCFACVVSEENETTIKHLAINRNINMAASELKLERFKKVMQLFSLVLLFDPSIIKALFRRVKAALGLHNIQQALDDLRKASWIEPSNLEILNELIKAKNVGC